mmetsp:Transcript_25187/g.70722  ORF Transcript_25187/g.70722 Transcript_25187/m.70722 type:complete len:150 (+) Transcript_25187:817-1266(+)
MAPSRSGSSNARTSAGLKYGSASRLMTQSRTWRKFATRRLGAVAARNCARLASSIKPPYEGIGGRVLVAVVEERKDAEHAARTLRHLRRHAQRSNLAQEAALRVERMNERTVRARIREEAAAARETHGVDCVTCTATVAPEAGLRCGCA